MADRVKLSPNIFSYPDFEHFELHMEISLGGVNKEDIILKMHDDSFFLQAPRDDFDYVASMALCCPVKASEAKAKFENGILKVIVPFKDRMEDAVQIEVT
jgi:HSP20 family protein